MTSPQTPFFSWEAQGRNAAPLLEKINAVVIAGNDPVAAASFALGVARVQGSVRRVAIADLVGEVAPLQALVTGDDAHGISDSFLYGVSLNKIARPLEGSGNVFLMPSGTEPVAIDTVYGNDRWRKLAAGFQQVGALLLIVAVPGAPGFADLCAYVGAVFPIGDPAPVVPAGVPVIMMPRPSPPEVERVVAKARAVGSEDAGTRRNRIIAIVLAMIGVALLVGFLWPQILERLPAGVARYLSSTDTRLAGDTTVAVTLASVPTRFDSVATANAARDSTAKAALAGAVEDSAAHAAPLPKLKGPLVVANPEDSAHAAVYAVYVATDINRNTARDPRMEGFPAVAISPVILGTAGEHWFRVTVGAGEDEPTIEAVLARLRAGKILGPTSGSIVRVPYAFRLEQGLAPDAAMDAVARYARRGIAAYALKQDDGKISIFTGAHESVAQAAILADSLRSIGIAPVLVFRTGRAF